MPESHFFSVFWSLCNIFPTTTIQFYLAIPSMDIQQPTLAFSIYCVSLSFLLSCLFICVVYNVIKGVYSYPDSLLSHASRRSLFRTTTDGQQEKPSFGKEVEEITSISFKKEKLSSGGWGPLLCGGLSFQEACALIDDDVMTTALDEL